jgi:AcrR family transcriptional regulator
MQRKNKYDDIVAAAHKLFYKYGIRKVTIDEICTEANVSKVTFYKHLTNKTELAKKVLDDIFNHFINRLSSLMDSSAPFPEKMHGILQLKVETAKGANVAFVLDLYRNSEAELIEYTRGKFKTVIALTADYLIDAQQKGLIRSDLNPTLLIALLDKMQELAFDDRVLHTYKTANDMGIEITKFFLYGVLGH